MLVLEAVAKSPRTCCSVAPSLVKREGPTSPSSPSSRIPTFLGQQPISQQQLTYQPNVDYLTDPSSWALIQNGGSTGQRNQEDPQLRFTHTWRSLSALTHMDMLYQEYFVAFLVLPCHDRRTSEPGQPVQPLEDAARLRYFRRPARCRDAR